MKKVYVAHPLRGGELDLEKAERNIARADGILRELAASEPDLLLFSPIHAFGYLDPLGPHEWVMKQCLEMVELCDELWAFGDWESSEGCRAEVARARELGKPIFPPAP